MDIGTAVTIGSAIFGAVSVIAIVASKFAPKIKQPTTNGGSRGGGGFCMEHPEVRQDVRTIKKVVLRLAKHSGIETEEYEDLVS